SDLVLELGRAPALGRVRREERRIGPELLQRLDDPGRIGDRLPVDDENRDELLPRHPEDAGQVEAGKEGTADVRDALPVEGPAHLLVEVRETEVPENGGR